MTVSQPVGPPNQRFIEEIYPTFQRADAEVRSFFNGIHDYASAYFNLREVPQGARRDLSISQLDRAGLQFANVLRYLDQHEGLDEYTRLLSQLIPDLRRVKPIDVSDEHVGVRLHVGDGRPFKMSEMSDGTIKAMILALLLATPVHMSLLSLDEPELNLHPAWLHIIGGWLLKCRSADQLMISTHSPEILDALTPAFRAGEATLLVFNTRAHRGVRRVEPSKLDSFFDEGWELGDLYRVGEPKLGGWPF
jgi:predicted ATPase